MDPNSGSAAMLEIARSFGTMMKSGWQPRRTIVFASWDGEEYGLLGSTEWVEEYATKLSSNAVVYLNVDCFKGAQVFAGGSPSIASFLLDTAKAVPDLHFQDQQSLYTTWMDQSKSLLSSKASFLRQHTFDPSILVGILGSGTDFTPFYQHLGIISANLGFNISTYGVYHSTMDSIMYMDRYADPEYASHVTTARWWGLLALRLASTKILPFNYTHYAHTLQQYAIAFESKCKSKGHSILFTALFQEIQKFTKAASKLTALQTRSLTSTNELQISKLNEKLMRLERHFLLPNGLPHRSWYKHSIFGPGYYKGYGATAFPAIADAIALNESTMKIQQQLHLTANAIRRATVFLLRPLLYNRIDYNARRRLGAIGTENNEKD